MRLASRITAGTSRKKEKSIHTTMGRTLRLSIRISPKTRIEQAEIPPQQVNRNQDAHRRQHFGGEHPKQNVARPPRGEEGHAVGRRDGQRQSQQRGSQRNHHAVSRERQVIGPLRERRNSSPGSGWKNNAGGVATAVISVLKLVRNIQRMGKNIPRATAQPATASPQRDCPALLIAHPPGCAPPRA